MAVALTARLKTVKRFPGSYMKLFMCLAGLSRTD